MLGAMASVFHQETYTASIWSILTHLNMTLESHFWYVDSQYSNNAVTIYTGLTNNESYCWATSYLARMYDFVYPNQYYVSSSLALDSTTYP
jgi:hypothetical protein